MKEETWTLKERADALFGRRAFRRSLRVYRELMVREPADPRLRVRSGELLHRLGELDEAIELYLQAARLFWASSHAARARAAERIAWNLDRRRGGNRLRMPAPELFGPLKKRAEPPPLPRNLEVLEEPQVPERAATIAAEVQPPDEELAPPADLISEQDFEAIYPPSGVSQDSHP